MGFRVNVAAKIPSFLDLHIESYFGTVFPPCYSHITVFSGGVLFVTAILFFLFRIKIKLYFKYV